MEEMYDIIIIGAGPGGMTAGIYAARRALKTLIITMDIGGQVATTPHIENYPGFSEISGSELSQKMYEQAMKFGVEFLLSKQVDKLEKKDPDAEAGTGDHYIVRSGNESYRAKKIILAFGKTPRRLDVPGDKEFSGRGVSYCATCDGPLFREKTVAVVGGGNSALDSALYLSKIAKKVYLIHRRDKFRGEVVMQNQVIENEKIEKIYDSVVTEVLGGQVVEKIKIKNIKTEEEREIELDGVFVEVGFVVKSDFVKELVALDESGQIIVDGNMHTSDPGIFAIGDLTPVPYKQIAISTGHGTIAALAAYDDLQREAGKPTGGVDWGK